MTLQRVSFFAALMVAGGGLAFLLGALSTRPDSDGLYSSVALTTLTTIAIVVGTALRLVLDTERRVSAEVALGALLFSALLAVFVLGVFAPYLGGWGDRDLNQFGGNDSTWRSWLTFLLVLAGVSGVVFGAFVGFLSWAARSIRFQRN